MALDGSVRRVRAEIRIAESNRRIAASLDLLRQWRHLRPRIAGGATYDTLRDTVRARLADGTLNPTDGVRAWAGFGTGCPCHVCGELIRCRDIEHEIVEMERPRLVHAACLRIWVEESLNFTSHHG